MKKKFNNKEINSYLKSFNYSKRLNKKGAYLNIYDTFMSESKILFDIQSYDFLNNEFKVYQNLNDAINSVDIVVIFNNQNEFKNIDSKVIFDGRGITDNSTYAIGKSN